MRDRIFLTRLSVFAHHGVFPEEERLGQRFLISVEGQLDLTAAGQNDDYLKSVDYAALAQCVQNYATAHRFQTLEGLAHALSQQILAAFSALTCVTIRVEKPHAPMPFSFESVGVEITRSRLQVSVHKGDHVR
jgi:7,8-dihydroneopterin aldolase/epimerase/oxygenase